jgi:O-acetyl-ADP-ribose deacetylase
MINHSINGVRIELMQGDIVSQKDVTAIVNAANAELRIGGGVAGAIHRAAGPGLEDACRPLAPIRPGEAVLTGGYNLPNKYVIHCLGPIYGINKPEDKLLMKCYRNALKIAEENNINSVAFPAISTGAFGYPLRPAAEIAFKTVIDETDTLKSVKTIRFVLFGKKDYDVHAAVLKQITGK